MVSDCETDNLETLVVEVDRTLELLLGTTVFD